MAEAVVVAEAEDALPWGAVVTATVEAEATAAVDSAAAADLAEVRSAGAAMAAVATVATAMVVVVMADTAAGTADTDMAAVMDTAAVMATAASTALDSTTHLFLGMDTVIRITIHTSTTHTTAIQHTDTDTMGRWSGLQSVS